MDRKRLARSPLLWIAVGLVFIFLVSQVVSGGSEYKSVKTSEALSQIDNNNVQSATIHDKEQSIDLVLKSPLDGHTKITANYPATCANPVTCNKPNFIIEAGQQTDFTWDGTHGGVLTVTDGALHARVTLFGQYAAAGFSTVADQEGGAIVTYQDPSTSQTNGLSITKPVA